MANPDPLELWHLTLSSSTRHTLLPREDLRRRALRRVFGLTASDLTLYSIVDDHLHLVLQCPVRRAGVLRGSIKRMLQPLVPGAMDINLRQVEGRSHMQWLLRYFLVQVAKHEVQGEHPALWAGSCFQELCGARILTNIGARLREALPRVSALDAHEIVGLPRQPLAAATRGAVRAAGATRLVNAAGVSLLAGPVLFGKTAPVMLAKRTVVQVGRRVGIPGRELCWALGVNKSAVSRLQTPRVDESVMRAVAVRVALEDIIAGLRSQSRVASQRALGSAP